MATPQLFGAPNPQDTGGAMSSLIGAQSRAAESQLAAIQGAVAQAVQGLQFGLQIRQRKDEQLREIEAQSTLEQIRQAAADRRANAELEQRRTEFGADLSFRREGRTMDQANADRAFGLNERQFGEDVRYRGVMEGLQREQLGIMQADSQASRQKMADDMARARENDSYQRQIRAGRDAATRFVASMGSPVDAFGRFDPEKFQAFQQTLQSMQGPQVGPPGPGQFQPGDGFQAGATEAFMGQVQQQQQMATGAAGAETDRMRAVGAIQGDGGFMLQGEPVFPVSPGALDALGKTYTVSASDRSAFKADLEAASTNGVPVMWDARRGRIVGGNLTPDVRSRIEAAIAGDQRLGAAFSGASALAYGLPTEQREAGQALMSGMSGPGAASAPPPPPPPPDLASSMSFLTMKEPTAPGAQQAQPVMEPQAAEQAYFGRVGAGSAPVEAPPQAEPQAAPQRGGMQEAPQSMRGARPQPQAPARPQAPAARVVRPVDELHKLVGGVNGGGSETLNSPQGRAMIREKLREHASRGSSDFERIATLAISQGLISEAAVKPLRETQANERAQRDRAKRRGRR